MGRLVPVLVVVTLAIGGSSAVGRAQSPVVEISGDIAALTLDRPDDPTSSARIVIGTDRVAIGGDVQIELPAASVTAAQLFAQAPAGCRQRGESGIAAADRCRSSGATAGVPQAVQAPEVSPEAAAGASAPVAKVTISAERAADGRLVAVTVQITKNVEEFWGGVTFVNESDGYLRVNGVLRRDEGGTIVRLNDPFKQQSDQQGIACGTEGNCSPDARFRLDPARLSVRFERGNPACIGGDAQACPPSNRLVPADDTITRVPIAVGDNVKAEGAFETAGGSRFFSAQAVLVQGALSADR